MSKTVPLRLQDTSRYTDAQILFWRKDCGQTCGQNRMNISLASSNLVRSHFCWRKRDVAKKTGQLFSQRSLQTNALELSWNHCETGPESGKEISRDFPSPNSLWSEFSCIQTWDTNEVGRERNIGITRKTCDRARPAYRYYIQKETSPLFSLSLAHSESEDVCHTFFLPCISPESQPSCECPLLCGLAGWREGPLLTWDPSRSLYARGLNATRYLF